MAKTPRKKTLTPPRNAWESTLEEAEGSDRSQAGEIEPGDEEGGGGNKGIDAETRDGGYSGDAVEAGHEESLSQPDRPLDQEIHGDPRTRDGESYPDDTKVVDEEQGPIGEGAEKIIEEEQEDEHRERRTGTD